MRTNLSAETYAFEDSPNYFLNEDYGGAVIQLYRETYNPMTRIQSVYVKVEGRTDETIVVNGLITLHGSQVENLYYTKPDLDLSDRIWGLDGDTGDSENRGLEGEDVLNPLGVPQEDGIIRDRTTIKFLLNPGDGIDDFRILVRFNRNLGNASIEFDLDFNSDWSDSVGIAGLLVGDPETSSIPSTQFHPISTFPVQEIKQMIEAVDIQDIYLDFGSVPEGEISIPLQFIVQNTPTDNVLSNGPNSVDLTNLVYQYTFTRGEDHLGTELAPELLPQNLLGIFQNNPTELPVDAVEEVSLEFSVLEGQRAGCFDGLILVFEDNSNNGFHESELNEPIDELGYKICVPYIPLEDIEPVEEDDIADFEETEPTDDDELGEQAENSENSEIDEPELLDTDEDNEFTEIIEGDEILEDFDNSETEEEPDPDLEGLDFWIGEEPEPEENSPPRGNLRGGIGCLGSVNPAPRKANMLVMLLLFASVCLAIQRRKTYDNQKKRNAYNKFLTIFCFVLLYSFPSTTEAFEIERLKIPTSSDRLIMIDRGTILPPLTFSFSITGSYENDPLIYYRDNQKTEDVISKRVLLSGSASLGVFEWLDVGCVLSLIPYQDGTDATTSQELSSFGIQDILLAARVKFFENSWLRLGTSLGITAPIGSDEDYMGEDSWTLQPRVIATALISDLVISFNLGILFADRKEIANITENHQLALALGASYSFLPGFEVGLEVTGSTDLTTPFSDTNSLAIEGFLGAKYHLTPNWFVGMGGGTSIIHGYGVPSWRAILNFGYVPQKEEPIIVEIPDDNGITQCQGEEDFDGFRDDDGCPDPDNDGDEILDTVDGAPNMPEDFDGFDDNDGIPDIDNDQDGLFDSEDPQPNIPTEIKDKENDKNPS